MAIVNFFFKSPQQAPHSSPMKTFYAQTLNKKFINLINLNKREKNGPQLIFGGRGAFDEINFLQPAYNIHS